MLTTMRNPEKENQKEKKTTTTTSRTKSNEKYAQTFCLFGLFRVKLISMYEYISSNG